MAWQTRWSPQLLRAAPPLFPAAERLGGDGGLGVLNAIRTLPLSKDGYEIVHGTSYLQIVTFDDRGPVVDGVLTYDQSVGPNSPYYSPQVELFSRSQLYRFPFTQTEIRADAGDQPVALPDDPILHRAVRTDPVA